MTHNSPKSERSDIKQDDGVRICCSQRRGNQNVVMTIVLCTFYGLADNLWSGTVFAAYLLILNNGSSSAVGYVEAANGLAGLFTALPVGYIADKYGRSKVIKFGGVMLIITVVLQVLLTNWVGIDEEALANDSKKVDRSFLLFMGVMSLWGLAGGVVNGPVQALYADSTPRGTRSQYYVWLFTAYMLSSCAGPLVAIILFQYLGDDWNLADLRTVIFCGMGLELLAGATMFFFDDDKALEEGDDQTNDDDSRCDKSVDESIDEHFKNHNENASKDLIERRKRIPYILFTLSLLVSFGSGMTVKFFPLFFKDTVGLSPSAVQTIYLIVPIAMVIFSTVNQKLAKKIGRVQTCIIVKILGLAGLYALIFFKDYLNSHPYVIVPVYVWRTGMMNSTYPLEESILMDFVPKNQRGRWKSLESVSQFGWCGSAMLGGIFSDAHDGDYTFTFLITALLQTAGSLGFFWLIPLIPKDEKDTGERGTTSLSSSMSEPLLRSEDSCGGDGEGLRRVV